MAEKLTTIALDADDTLWHTERMFQMTQTRFAALLAPFADIETLEARLLEAELRNLGHYGFGVKGFVLSMIETAIGVTKDAVTGDVIAELLEAGQQMLADPIELFDGVADAVAELAEHRPLILITKGDLLDQERKIAQSGLGDHFEAVEIVSHKTPDTYAAVFSRLGIDPTLTMMVGDSLKSDVHPLLELGGWATHIPHDYNWSLEHAEPPLGHPRFHQITQLADLPQLIATFR